MNVNVEEIHNKAPDFGPAIACPEEKAQQVIERARNFPTMHELLAGMLPSCAKTQPPPAAGRTYGNSFAEFADISIDVAPLSDLISAQPLFVRVAHA